MIVDFIDSLYSKRRLRRLQPIFFVRTTQLGRWLGEKKKRKEIFEGWKSIDFEIVRNLARSNGRLISKKTLLFEMR